MEENKIQWGFYSKLVASPFCIMYRSALPQKSKRETLLQEGLRRFRNFCPGINPCEIQRCLSQFMWSLLISGYDLKFRNNLLEGILKRVSQIREEINSGSQVEFRDREQIITQKQASLGKYPNTWFLSNTIQNTLKVQATPASGLAGKMRNCLRDNLGAEGGGTKIVELGGKSVTSGLSVPVRAKGNQQCGFSTKCNIEKGENCQTARYVYQVECLNCQEENRPRKALFVGTSCHSCHKRQMEHLAALNRRQRSNAMAKHHLAEHRNSAPKFQSKPVRGPMTYNLDRFILEGLLIEQNCQNPEVFVLNQRGEWGGGGLVRLAVTDQV